MRKKTYLVLHKSEWDRLHRRKEDLNRLADERDEYFRKLNEKSQSWVRTWPDTALGHVELIAKQKEKQHAEDLVLVKKGRKIIKKEKTKEAIQNAKQQIFEDSCYGKKLLSALMESKALEERNSQIEFQKLIKKQTQEHEKEMQSKLKQCSFDLDEKEKETERQKREIEKELAKINKSIALMESKALEERNSQIEFQKLIKKQTQEHEKEMQSKLKQCSFDLDEKEKETERQKREIEKELAKINKSMHEMELSKRLKLKEEQKVQELEDAKLMQELLDNEARQEKAYENLLNQDAEKYKLELKFAKDRKFRQEKKEEAIVNAQRVELERRQCKIKAVMKQIHGDKHNTEQFKRTYESTKEMQVLEKTRYDEFVQKGIKQLEESLVKKEQEEYAKKKSDSEKRQVLAKCNQLAAEEAEQMRRYRKHAKKYVGDRQCILPKSCHQRKIKATSENTEKELSFLGSSSKLRDQLLKRSVAPSPWNGLEAAHAHFARAAGEILQECRYKHFARKVVDEYRKDNYLDSITLPVPNY